MRAPVPTLVVRSAVPFEAWARGEQPLKCLVAFDFTGRRRPRCAGQGLAAAGPCELVVGYVDWPVGEAARLGITGQFLLSHNPPQVQRILERELSERVAALLGRGCRPHSRRTKPRSCRRAAGGDCARGASGPRCRRHTPAARLGPRRASVDFARLAADAPMSVACIPAARVETIERQSAPIRRVLAASDLSEHGSLAIPVHTARYLPVASCGCCTSSSRRG